jgi:glycine/D-amino acid oxidase-like deaminating enzyme
MDLLSPRPFWPIRDGLPATFPPLAENATCDVAIVGAGISGAMIATQLVEAGFETLVLDRREAAHGSTAGNTGLVLYELDTMLHQLARRIGVHDAQRTYRRCRSAIAMLERWVRRLSIECDFARRQSLYLAASDRHVVRLQREFEARRAAGLDVEWWPRRRIAAQSSLPHRAAILTHEAAQLDAYRLTYGLLQAAQRRGARIHDRTAVTSWKPWRNGVELVTSRGARVRARHLVVSAGYEAGAFLPRRVARLHSTFALITEPVSRESFADWPANRCMLWDTANPYLYLRTTADDRVLIGGYDERFYGPHARDRMLRAKVAALKRRLGQFFPDIPFEVATAWAGTFGITDDGLPCIGQHPERPHMWFALGFGGNGITFSVVAAEIIREALLGRTDPDAGLFGFRRLCGK